MNKSDILELHNSVESFDSVLLNRYDTKTVKKLDSLLELGFKNSSHFEENNFDSSKDFLFYKKILELKQKYPLKKFITFSEIKKLSKKYNLWFAPIKFYSGNIPDKNLKDILDNKKNLIKNEDRVVYNYADRYEKFSDERSYSIEQEFPYTILTAPETIIKRYNSTILETRKTIKNGFFKKFISTEVVETYYTDPVIFLKVNDNIFDRNDIHNGVYEIITAWGLEANDELVINEKLN